MTTRNTRQEIRTLKRQRDLCREENARLRQELHKCYRAQARQLQLERTVLQDRQEALQAREEEVKTLKEALQTEANKESASSMRLSLKLHLQQELDKGIQGFGLFGKGEQELDKGTQVGLAGLFGKDEQELQAQVEEVREKDEVDAGFQAACGYCGCMYPATEDTRFCSKDCAYLTLQ